MALPTVPGALSQDFRAGFLEIIELVEPGIDKLVEIEKNKIARMPKAAQAEIYSRFAALFDKGVKEPNKDGLALFSENKEHGKLLDVIFEVSSDIGLANNVLSDEKKLAEALSKTGFSEAAINLIEKEVGQKLNPAEQKSLILSAVRKIFGPMDFEKPVNTEPKKKSTNRKRHARGASSSTSSNTNGSHDAANHESKKNGANRKNPARIASDLTSSKTNGANNDETNGHKISKQFLNDSDHESLTNKHYQTGSEPLADNGAKTPTPRDATPDASQQTETQSETNGAHTPTPPSPAQTDVSNPKPRPEPTNQEIDEMADIGGSGWLAKSILSGMPFSMEHEAYDGW